MEKTLYYGGRIITMQDTYPEAVLVQDGRIVSIGSLNEYADCDALRMDLSGKTMLPGFIDPHSHFSQVASNMLQVSLVKCISIADIQKTIADYIRDAKPEEGTWIVCTGYDHNRLNEKRHPDRYDLDDVSEAYPILIQHQSGHAGVLNTDGLKALHIDKDTPDPEGGRYGRRDAELTGYLEENAFFNTVKSVPAASGAQLMDAYHRAQDRYASFGITTVQEGYMVSQMIPMYQMLLQNKMLKLDLVGYPDIESYEEFCRLFKESVKKYDSHFKIGGLKMFLDGSPQARTAWMRKPYANESEYCGYGTLKDESVYSNIMLADRYQTQILAHCNGDAAAAQYLSQLKKAKNSGADLAHMKPVMIHAQLLDTDQLDEVKALSVIPSFFIAHIYHFGDTHIRNFSFERAERISCAGSALSKGIHFTFHQDAPVIEPDMLETIWCAVNRVTSSGVLLGKEERIPVYEAIKAVTVNAAEQYSETDKGSIKPGSKADFVILAENPLEAEPMHIRDIKVLETIKDGVTVYRR